MAETPPFSPMLALLVVAHSLEAELTAQLRPLDLTPRKYALLGHIKASPGVSFSELARRSQTSVQNVHVAVKALTASGFVHDDTAQAGASSTLRISKAGLQVLTRAHNPRAAIDDRIRETMPGLADGLAGALRTLTIGPADEGR